MTAYLDCNATTPVDPAVQALVLRFMAEEYGNAGSRTHDFGARALQALHQARDQVAAVVGAKRDEVVFTSGATEANNLALLGLAAHGEKTERKHLISTQIEHKAVLEPLEVLAARGFEITLLPPNRAGWVEPGAVAEALRPDTLLVSVMQANNETGVIQPLDDICDVLRDHAAYFHVDAAQGFGKVIAPLRNRRIDLLSISGHKIYAPKGIGALITRRRGFDRAPLSPLMFGGGQERGLRPGTVPVALAVGLGLAAELAQKDFARRLDRVQAIREQALSSLAELAPQWNGDPERSLPHVLNLSLSGLDSEAVMLAWKGLAAVSNGSACTSHSYAPSHVLQAMGLDKDQVRSALRISWCHLTEDPPWSAMAYAVKRMR